MDNSGQQGELIEKFYQRYLVSSDAQILEILKNKKDYQEAAIHAAVKVAIERELIHTEQDLMGPEFQQSRAKGFSLFPEISNAYHKRQLTGSIFRFLYVMSLVPVVYGFLKYAEGQTNHTILGVGIGLVWFILAFMLQKTKRKVILIPQFLILVIVLVFVGIQAIKFDSLQILDLIMLAVGTLLPAYLLFYLRKILDNNSDAKS